MPGSSVEKSVLAKLAADRAIADLEKVGGVTGLAKALGSDVKSGIPSKGAVEASRELYGGNRLPERKTRNFCQHLFDALYVSPWKLPYGRGCGLNRPGLRLAWAEFGLPPPRRKPEPALPPF